MIQIGVAQCSESDMMLWIEELRSGKWKQTLCFLQNNRGHCCMGVGCELFIPKDSQDRSGGVYLDGSLPNDQWESPEWLKNVDEDFEHLSGERLVDLNDDEYTFDEIADLLQAVYIERVLD